MTRSNIFLLLRLDTVIQQGHTLTYDRKSIPHGAALSFPTYLWHPHWLLCSAMNKHILYVRLVQIASMESYAIQGTIQKETKLYRKMHQSAEQSPYGWHPAMHLHRERKQIPAEYSLRQVKKLGRKVPELSGRWNLLTNIRHYVGRPDLQTGCVYRTALLLTTNVLFPILAEFVLLGACPDVINIAAIRNLYSWDT